jgi:hypothetical protein
MGRGTAARIEVQFLFILVQISPEHPLIPAALPLPLLSSAAGTISLVNRNLNNAHCRSSSKVGHASFSPSPSAHLWQPRTTTASHSGRLRLFGSQAAHFPVILCLFHLIYTPSLIPCWCDNLGSLSRITILTPLTILYHSRGSPNSCAANI